MYYTNKKYESDMEILKTEANLVQFSTTVSVASGVDDGYGNKYVKSGSILNGEGKIVTVKEAEGENPATLSSTPVGVLYKTINVTYGDQPGSLIVEGYLRADRVLNGFSDDGIALIKGALPNIKFM